MKNYNMLDTFNINSSFLEKIQKDYLRFAEEGMPDNVEDYILKEYKIDISSRYGELTIKNPFGIASGQLSTNLSQINSSIEQGIGFIVLKTVISQDEAGNSSMDAWKINEPKMVVEEILSNKGEKGYTVTWKGRGWHKSFDDYLEFMNQSLKAGESKGVQVIPSCKFNLPSSKEEEFNEAEYAYTLEKLMKVWTDNIGEYPMHLEKDFSPTLAGSDLSKKKETILWWLYKVPNIIKKFAQEGKLFLGIKLMNATFEDEFQLKLLKSMMGSKENGVDYLICFNRLFDYDKVFEGKKGVAYGGFDLSDRNLMALTELRVLQQGEGLELKDIPISATGNVQSGKVMLEYALRGCENGQIHTYFQVPDSNYKMKKGNRVSKALYELIFNPETGLLAGMLYLNEKGLLDKQNNILKFSDVVQIYKKHKIFKNWDGEVL
jgi:dihydroorotate dehydrogenase